jgi:autotransporter-associated beta strand protein
VSNPRGVALIIDLRQTRGDPDFVSGDLFVIKALIAAGLALVLAGMLAVTMPTESFAQAVGGNGGAVPFDGVGGQGGTGTSPNGNNGAANHGGAPGGGGGGGGGVSTTTGLGGSGGAGGGFTSFESAGAGGGGGGAYFLVNPGTITSGTGAGGAGGGNAANASVAGGGGGGAGGGGVLFTGTGISVSNGVSISGGAGGNGGRGGSATNLSFGGGGSGGNGGGGGDGIDFTGTAGFTNTGTITGGNGGSGGAGGTGSEDNGSNGAAGVGGAGVLGAGLSITNSGTISGGFANAGAGARADALVFTGGVNSLDNTGGTLNGNIAVSGGLNFTQTGMVSLSNIVTDGPNGAGSVINSGTGTLTLSGANTYSGGTTLSTGSTLQLGVDAVFSGSAIVSSAIGTGTLTFDGGKLQALDFSIRNIANAIQITASGGIIDSGGGLFAISGNITDAPGSSGGKLIFESIAGAGIREVILSGVNTYSGITYIDSGTVIANSITALSPNSAFQVNKGATLTLSGFSNTIASLADGASGGGVVQNGGGVSIATLTISGTAGVTTSFSGVLQNGSIGGGLIITNDEGGTPITDVTIIVTEPSPILNIVKSGASTQILAGLNTYTGTTTINGGVLEVDGSIASSSMTSVNASGVLTGVGTVGNTTVASGGTLLPGNGTPGSFLSVTGNLAFQSGALYLVQLSPATSTFTKVSGTAALNGLAGASFAAGSYISKQYTILTAAGGVSGTFSGLQTLGLPSGFTASLSYDAKDAFLNLALGFNGPNYGGGLNVNQQNVANALTNFFNATGGIPMVFGTLTPAGLTQVSGELATGSQQATFDAMNLFMGLLTDPSIAGRGGSPTPGAGAPTGYASTQASGAARDAYAMFTKAPLAQTYDPRWSVWSAGFGSSQTTDGNATLGSNTTTSSVYGTAVGADYRISPFTVAGFALAGGGTNFSVAGSGSGHSDLFQAGAFIRHTIGQAYISASLAYGWQDITTNRTVTVAGTSQLRAQFDANAFSGRLEGGYRFVAPWVGGIGITP